MKKVLALLLGLHMLLSLIACGSSSEGPADGATLWVENDAFVCKAQDLIDVLNDEIENTGDSRYLSIPDFEGSGEKIVIDDSTFNGLILVLETNDEGFVTKITVEWTTFRETLERINTCGLLIGRLVGSIAPEQAEEIYLQLDFDASGTPEYTTMTSANGTDFVYSYHTSGMYQSMNIFPTVE